MNHAPLLTSSCDNCFHPFPAVSPLSRFCCKRCRGEHWRKVYKRFATVDLFMQIFRLSDRARYYVMLALDRAEAKCYQIAALLGYRYRPHQRRWVHQP